MTPLLLTAGVIAAAVAGGALVRRLRARDEDRARELADAERRMTHAILHADAIIEHMSSGLVTVTRGGHVGHLNPAGAAILGLSADAARGLAYSSVFADGLAPLGAALERALRFGTAERRMEMELTRGGAHVPVGVSTSVLRDPDGAPAGALAIFQDLTRVRELEATARRQQTLAAIGELTAGIAHEIRNAVRPISGSVDVLRREIQPTGDLAALLDLVATECDRIQRFVGDLLAYGRQRPLAREPVSVAELLVGVAAEMQRHTALTTGLTLRVQPPDTSLAVRGDAEALRQVLVNLCLNGAEAMGGRGALVLRASRAEGATPTGDTITISVADEGRGIAPKDRDRIFEAFYTTKNGGTGLGLAIAQRIVEGHEGRLAVESAPGRGTTVAVTLPAATHDALERAA